MPFVANTLDFPPEILIKICEALRDLPTSKTNGIPEVMRLAATCRTLRTIARPVLYRHFNNGWLGMLELPGHKAEPRASLHTKKFFHLLVCMQKGKAADLVRHANLNAITQWSDLPNWNYNWDVREQPDDDFYTIIQSLKDLGLEPEYHQDCSAADVVGLFRMSSMSILVNIFLSLFRDALILTLPFDTLPFDTATSLAPLGRCYLPYPAGHVPRDHGDGHTEDRLMLNPCLGKVRNATCMLSDTTDDPQPAFPDLQQLELMGIGHAMGFNPRHLWYIDANAPQLRTIRLSNFVSVPTDAGGSTRLRSITSLSVVGCCLSYLDIRRLVLVCPSLKRVKISESFLDRGRSVIWTGEEGFAETYEGVHPDDADEEDDFQVAEIDEETNEMYIPYSSSQVSSSLVLQALEPLAESLDSVLLGACQLVRVAHIGTERELHFRRRKLNFTPFSRLQRIGIWTGNLFPQGKMVDDVFTEILGDCPTVKNLSIFSTQSWDSSKSDTPVGRALGRLCLDVQSGRVGASLRMVRLCHRSDNDPGSGPNAQFYPVEEGATVMGEPVTGLFVKAPQEDHEQEDEDDDNDNDDVILKGFRTKGIKFATVRGKNQYERDDAFRADEILCDYDY